MKIAYWCILIAALLPYIWTVMAKLSTPGFDNHNPKYARRFSDHFCGV